MITTESIRAMLDALGKPNRAGVWHATTAAGDLTLDQKAARELLGDVLILREVSPIAYMRDTGTADEPCYVPAAKGDPGAFPVYGMVAP